MSSSAQLEQDAERTRTDLSHTLEELRERMTPGQLVDQALDYAKDTTGGQFMGNLRQQLATNPLPVLLIGAGIGWLALGKGNAGSAAGPSAAKLKGALEGAQARAGEAARSAGERLSGWSAQARDKLSGAGSESSEGGALSDHADRATERMQEWSAQAAERGNQLGDMAHSFTDSATDAASQAKDTWGDVGASLTESATTTYGSAVAGATSAARTLGDAATDTYGRVAGTAARTGSTIAQSASSFGEKVTGAGGSALQFCKGQPLLLASLGLALGALLGALIPPTDTEDHLMGESSDRLKEQARDTAQAQIDQAKAAVERALEQAPAQAEHVANAIGEAATTSLVPEDEETTAKLPLE
jgi:hypothetical protein